MWPGPGFHLVILACINGMFGAFQVALVVKNPPANAGDVRDKGPFPELGRFPGGGNGQPTPGFLPGESHGQRILAGYGP